MNTAEQMNILPYILIAGSITFGTRLLPFLIFKDQSSVPPIVSYIAKYLPPAIISGIVVYCLKGIDFTTFPFGLKEISASLLVVGLQFWKRNMLVSVFAGTIFYMILLQRF